MSMWAALKSWRGFFGVMSELVWLLRFPCVRPALCFRMSRCPLHKFTIRRSLMPSKVWNAL